MVNLSTESKKEIVHAIAEAERLTSGEIRVHLQKKTKKNVFELAKAIFLKLKMHKTKDRNAVLILVALDSREFAIIGDSGIHEKTGDNFWQSTRDEMLTHFKNDNIKEAILAGVRNAGQKLQTHFPRKNDDKNELPNKVSVN